MTEAYGCSARYGRRLPALVVAAVILTLGGVRALAEEAGTDGTPKTVVAAQGPLDLVQSSVWLVFSIVRSQPARVQSRLVTHRGAEIPLEYRLLERAGRWAVYDVVVDGVSQVASYRSQFNSVLRTSSFDLFLDKLRNEARLTPAGGEAP